MADVAGGAYAEEEEEEEVAAPRHLLVLDVNGLLVDRTLSVLQDDRGSAVEPSARLGAFCVYDRPGLRRFVAFLLRRFHVGVWSSARQHNLTGLVAHIFGADQAQRLAFVWRAENENSGRAGVAHTHTHSVSAAPGARSAARTRACLCATSRCT